MGNDINTWALDMYPVVVSRFQDKYEEKISMIKDTIGFIKKKQGTGNQYQEEGIGGYGYVPEYDGTEITEANQKRGFVATYTPIEKALKVSIKRKYSITDQSGEAKRVGDKLSRSATITMIRDFYRLFSNGWNSSYKGPDNLSLFNASHPVNNEAGADTFSNTGTSAFSVSAITATESIMNRYKTYDGADFAIEPNLVLLSPELEPKARQFFGENSKLLPESAENDSNPVSTYKYKVIKGFTAKQWSLADSQLLKELVKCIVITDSEVHPWALNPLIQQFIVYMDYVMGWSDARCIFGHNPA